MPQFDEILGRAVLKLWPEPPQPVQERLFECVPDDPGLRNSLAQFLHDRHPKTAHPPKPAAVV